MRIQRSGLKANGWLRIIRKTENSYYETLLGEPQDWLTHEAEESPYLEAEEKRLGYVAATRAREMLVISRCTGTVRNPAWSVLDSFLAEAKELDIPAVNNGSPAKPLDCGQAAQAVPPGVANWG